MIRLDPIIAVKNVEASAEWYCNQHFWWHICKSHKPTHKAKIAKEPPIQRTSKRLKPNTMKKGQSHNIDFA